MGIPRQPYSVIARYHGETKPLYAHTPNPNGDWHCLEDHLKAVSELAHRFGAKFEMAEVCQTLGLVHDLGKANPAFQRYLMDCSQNGPSASVPHSAPGAAASNSCLQGFSLAVLGHHAGLANPEDAKAALQAADSEATKAASKFAEEIKLNLCEPLGLPKAESKRQMEMLVRMCFSALVDADRLDTEQHFTAETSQLRALYQGADWYSCLT